MRHVISAEGNLTWQSWGVLIALAALLVKIGGILTLLVPIMLSIALAILIRPEIGLALAVFTSIIWLLGAFRVPGIPLLGPAQALLALTMLAWAIWAMMRRVPLTFAPHMRPLMIFTLVVCASVVTTSAPVSDNISGIHKIIMALLIYFLVANIAVTRPAIERVVWFILFTLFVSVGLAFIELYLPGIETNVASVELGARIDPSLDSGPIKRVSGGLGDGNWFSYTLATGIPLAIYVFRTSPRIFIRIFAALLVVLMSYGIVLSYTRTGFVGLAGAGLYLMWRRKLPWPPIVAFLIVGAISSPIWMPQGFADRVFSVKYLTSGGSTSIREEIVRVATVSFLEKPIFGQGFLQYGALFIKHTNTQEGLEMARRDYTGEEPIIYLQAHNLYLDIAMTYGLVGVLPFLAFIFILLRELSLIRARGSPEDEELATAIIACLIAFLVCGMGGHSQELKIFWVLAGLAAALRRNVLQGVSGTLSSAPPLLSK